MKIEDTEALKRYSLELNQARSKPNPDYLPVKLLIPLCTITMAHNTVAQRQLLIFPFLQPNITLQMRSNGGKRGSHVQHANDVIIHSASSAVL